MATAAPVAIHRCFTISRAHAVQPRAALPSCRILGQSTLGPILDSIAGSKVSTTDTLTSGISMPPMPMLRRNGTGHDDERDQADRNRDTGCEHGVACGLHRDHDGFLVVVAVFSLLTPT